MRFVTLGNPVQQTRELAEIEEVGEWRGRGNLLGYKLRFRDRKIVYLQNSVTNSVEAAILIRRHMGC